MKDEKVEASRDVIYSHYDTYSLTPPHSNKEQESQMHHPPNLLPRQLILPHCQVSKVINASLSLHSVWLAEMINRWTDGPTMARIQPHKKPASNFHHEEFPISYFYFVLSVCLRETISCRFACSPLHVASSTSKPKVRLIKPFGALVRLFEKAFAEVIEF